MEVFPALPDHKLELCFTEGSTLPAQGALFGLGEAEAEDPILVPRESMSGGFFSGQLQKQQQRRVPKSVLGRWRRANDA